MSKFYVMIREVHISTRLVEAANVEEALHDAGGADEVCCEYSHTLDPDCWTVEEHKDD